MNSVATPAASHKMSVLTASTRIAGGKTHARRLRASGQIPAIAYGKSLESTPLAVSPKDILTILKSDHGGNSVIQLGITGGQNILAMIRDYSYHPVTRALEHVDFVEVKLDQPVNVEIPLIALGKAAGVVMGGIVRQVFRTLPVSCLPDRIPLKIEVDISHLKLNEHVSTQDLKLDDGVTVRLPAEQTLVAIVTPEKEKIEAVVAPVAGAAAPAAGAAAGAKGATPSTPPPAKDAKKK